MIGEKKTPPTSSSTAFGVAASRRKLPGAPRRPAGTVDRHGVPPDQRVAAVRVRADRRAEDAAPASRRGRDRPRVRQPRHPVARRRGREARRGGAQPAQPPLLDEQGHPEAARSRSPTSTSASSASTLDFETEVCSTIGAKEGFSHLMLDARRPGRHRARAEPVVPDPHLGPDPRRRRRALRAHGPRPGLLREPARGVRAGVAAATRHRHVVPAQPDDRVRRPRVHDAARRVRARARDRRRARLRVRRSRLRRLRAAVDPAGARARRMSRSSSTRSRSRSRWRAGAWASSSATPRSSPRSAKLKSYLDYGTFQPIQIAATVAMNEAPDFPQGSERDLPRPPRHADRRARPHRLAHRAAQGDDVRLGADPRAVRRDDEPRVRHDAACRRPRSRSRPASGFGPGGEGFIRFALVENEQRIQQAVRQLRKGLTKLG